MLSVVRSKGTLSARGAVPPHVHPAPAQTIRIVSYFETRVAKRTLHLRSGEETQLVDLSQAFQALRTTYEVLELEA